jgi:hypothetical protein
MDDPFVDVMDPLRVLRERVESTLATHGLRAVHVGVVPGTSTEGPHELQILATIAGDGPTNDEEFNELMKHARDDDLDRRAAEARTELEQRMKRDGGFLD